MMQAPTAFFQPGPTRRWRAVTACLLALATAGAIADEYSDVDRLIRTGQLAPALARADQHLAAHPRDPQMRFLKGVILAESGQAQEAQALYIGLTQDYPELPEPHNNLATLYAAQGELGKARESLEMAVRLNPDYATAQENLGDVYLRMAAQAYDKARRLDRSNDTAAPKLKLIRPLLAPGTAGAPSADSSR